MKFILLYIIKSQDTITYKLHVKRTKAQNPFWSLSDYSKCFLQTNCTSTTARKAYSNFQYKKNQKNNTPSVPPSKKEMKAFETSKQVIDIYVAINQSH